jgi:hypothetical protein
MDEKKRSLKSNKSRDSTSEKRELYGDFYRIKEEHSSQEQTITESEELKE